MKLNEIKNEYSSGALDKWEYIDKMYQKHIALFEYADFIKSTNISKIEIADDKVIMTFRDSGVKMSCVMNDKRLAPFDALNFGNYEQDELLMQFELVGETDTVLDIGGNFGWYAIHIAKKFPQSKIYSFEPIPSTYQSLNENIKLNSITNIEAVNCGLSDNPGTFTFYFDPELSVNASLANVAGNSNVDKIDCRVETLDEWSKKINRIDFIKCDVEGAELPAFKGGTDTLKKHKPVVFCEMLRKWTAKFNYHPNDIIDFFSAMGYSCYIAKERRLRIFSRVDESTPETNYFYLHNEKHKLLIDKLTA